MKALVILSGGADSATLAYHARDSGFEVTAMTFNYGQRHQREIVAARAIAESIGAPHWIQPLQLAGLMPGSALTDPAVPVPHGHYNEETMRRTVVPNRNTIMLSIAWGVACANDMDVVALGIHAGDHHIYPDCRPEYLGKLEAALLSGTEGHHKRGLRLWAPFLHMDKGGIVTEGQRLGVPFEQTWTCYEGGEAACGQCGSCRERLEAFEHAGLADPLAYQS